MIGKQIKKARHLAGLTQKELGELCGKGISTVSEWESGKRSPDVELFPLIGEILHVSQAFLLDLTDDPHYIEKPETNEEIVPMDQNDIALVMRFRAADDWKKEAVKKILDLD